MTRRTVVWTPSAEAELAEIWLNSDSRNSVSSASGAIDSLLRNNAESAGIALSEGLMSLDEPPLRVIFEIIEDDLIVRILKVKQS